MQKPAVSLYKSRRFLSPHFKASPHHVGFFWRQRLNYLDGKMEMELELTVGWSEPKMTPTEQTLSACRAVCFYVGLSSPVSRISFLQQAVNMFISVGHFKLGVC